MLIAATGLGAVLLGASFVFSIRSAVDRERDALDDRLAIEAAGQVAVAEEYFDRARSLILLLADNASFSGVYDTSASGQAAAAERQAKLVEAQEALQYMQRLYAGRINEICFIDRSGPELARVTREVLAQSDELSPDESDNPFFAPTLELSPGDVYQAAPYVSPDTDEWVISNSAPVRDGDGEMPAMVHFEITLESFRALLMGAADGGIDTQIVDARTGMVLSDSRFPQVIGADLGRVDESFAVLAGTELDRGELSSDGRRAIFRRMATQPGNQNEWFIVASAPQAATDWTSGVDAASLSLLLTALALLAAGGLAVRSHNAVVRAAAQRSIEDARQQSRTMRDMLVNLGRRNQGLIGQQLALLDSMEAKETEAASLETLFQLDHMATRMRRNAENLLVLAGERTARTWSATTSIEDVLRAATAEVSELSRVEVRPGAEGCGAIAGRHAVDLSHLVAELVDNALRFSPPGTSVVLRAEAQPDEARIWVIDEGLGLSDEQLELENERIAHPPEIDGLVTDRVGLQVVGRLAQRLGVSVRLQSAPGGGIAARVAVPKDLLLSEPPSAPSAAPAAPATRRAPRAARPAPAAAPVANAVSSATSATSATASATATVDPAPPRSAPRSKPVTAEAAPPSSGTTKSGLPRRSAVTDAVQEAGAIADSGVYRRLPTTRTPRVKPPAADAPVPAERFKRLGDMQRAINDVRNGADDSAETSATATGDDE